MNPAALGQLIAAAFGIAISPVSVVTVILLLLSPRARSASVGFLLGWTFGIVAAATAFALLSAVVPLRVPGAAHTVLGIIQLVVGALLLVLGVAQWLRRRRADASRPPSWMRAIDRTTFALALPVGAVMAVNPPNLLLSLAAGIAIGASRLTVGEIAWAIALFGLVAASTVLVPVVGHLLAPGGLRQPLDAFRRWLTLHSAAILTALFLALGVISVGQGIVALAGD